MNTQLIILLATSSIVLGDYSSSLFTNSIPSLGYPTIVTDTGGSDSGGARAYQQKSYQQPQSYQPLAQIFKPPQSYQPQSQNYPPPYHSYQVQQSNRPDTRVRGSGYGESIDYPINAAIATKRTFEVRPIMLQDQPPEPSVVDVQPSEQPVQVIFRTQSSPVLVQQVHTPSQPTQVEKTSSEDDPFRVVHEVVRPVIQELHEIITPFRHHTQIVAPVVERVRTVISKAEHMPQQHQYHHEEKMYETQNQQSYRLKQMPMEDASYEMLGNGKMSASANSYSTFLSHPVLSNYLSRMAKSRRNGFKNRSKKYMRTK